MDRRGGEGIFFKGFWWWMSWETIDACAEHFLRKKRFWRQIFGAISVNILWQIGDVFSQGRKNDTKSLSTLLCFNAIFCSCSRVESELNTINRPIGGDFPFISHFRIRFTSTNVFVFNCKVDKRWQNSKFGLLCVSSIVCKEFHSRCRASICLRPIRQSEPICQWKNETRRERKESWTIRLHFCKFTQIGLLSTRRLEAQNFSPV